MSAKTTCEPGAFEPGGTKTAELESYERFTAYYYRPLVVRVARVFGKDEQRAAELVGDFYASRDGVAIRLRRDREAGRFGCYLWTAVRNFVRRALGREPRHVPLPGDVATGDDDEITDRLAHDERLEPMRALTREILNEARAAALAALPSDRHCEYLNAKWPQEVGQRVLADEQVYRMLGFTPEERQRGRTIKARVIETLAAAVRDRVEGRGDARLRKAVVPHVGQIVRAWLKNLETEDRACETLPS